MIVGCVPTTASASCSASLDRVGRPRTPGVSDDLEPVEPQVGVTHHDCTGGEGVGRYLGLCGGEASDQGGLSYVRKTGDYDRRHSREDLGSRSSKLDDLVQALEVGVDFLKVAR